MLGVRNRSVFRIAAGRRSSRLLDHCRNSMVQLSTESEKQEGPKSFRDRLEDLKLSERVSENADRLKSNLFAGDETTWRDAFRQVFGLKPEEKAKQAPESTTTTASKQTTESSTEVETEKTPEDEAREFIKHQEQAKLEPSPMELKLVELGEQIQKLEAEREQAHMNEDMALFKQLNKRVREIRKEMENVQAKLNTDSLVLVEQRKGAWESFSEGLRDTPLLRSIFGFGESGKKLADAAEGAREKIESSQHPLVYRVMGVWDSMFAETEMGEAIREFRKIDPNFTMEGFVQEMEEEIIPVVLGAYLRADVQTLSKHLGEGAFSAVKAAIDERKQAGRRMDPNILNIQHTQVAAAKVVEKMGPMVVIQFMAQQVDALYDKAGNVVEGRDDRVAAVFYAFAITRESTEANNKLHWSIKEFAIVGTVPWI